MARSGLRNAPLVAGVVAFVLLTANVHGAELSLAEAVRLALEQNLDIANTTLDKRAQSLDGISSP